MGTCVYIRKNDGTLNKMDTMYAVICHCCEYITVSYHRTKDAAINRTYSIVNYDNVWKLSSLEEAAVLAAIEKNMCIRDNECATVFISKWEVGEDMAIRHGGIQALSIENILESM